MHGCCLLIPVRMHPEVLAQLHESHQGSVRRKQRVRLSVYWSSIDNDIDNTILVCQQCQDHLPSNPKEPIIQKAIPERPRQEIAVDFCSLAGCIYLIILDCFTDWPAITSLDHGTSALQVSSAIHLSFCRTAIQCFREGPMVHQMAHQMAQEVALWPSAMIRLGPHWCKVKWDGIVNWWVQHTILLHIVRLSCMAQLIIIYWLSYILN